MQALGAYSFLGHVKNKPDFLEHIPQGLARLRELLDAVERQTRAPAHPDDSWLPEQPLHRLHNLLKRVL
jgi:hypothetical protein